MNLIAVADDRSGAVETAAAIANVMGADVQVVVAAAQQILVSADPVVIDIASRHLAGDEAARRAVGAMEQVSRATDGTWAIAHKIDSTLRGNWAVEAWALAQCFDLPLLLVPALPAMNRVCRGGVVFDHDVPVHEGPAGRDARQPVRSARPADSLDLPGVLSVHQLATNQVTAWLEQASVGSIAVVDAVSDAGIESIIRDWAAHVARDRRPPIVAGTSAVIAAVAAVVAGRSGRDRVSLPILEDRGALVACGSLHPTARRQVAHAAGAGVHVTECAAEAAKVLQAGHDVVLVTPSAEGVVAPPDADRVSIDLAEIVQSLMTLGDVGTLVVIGGDTAEAILGHADMTVSGAPLPGTALVRVAGVTCPVIIRAGGFGDETAITSLLAALRKVQT